MTRSAFFRVVLVLLLVGGHLGLLPGTVRSGAEGAWVSPGSCCCVGECHCTGDCCSHPRPGGRTAGEPELRAGGGEPQWRSARGCGGWYDTLSRGPGQSRPATLVPFVLVAPPVERPRSAESLPGGIRSSTTANARPPLRGPPVRTPWPAGVTT